MNTVRSYSWKQCGEPLLVFFHENVKARSVTTLRRGSYDFCLMALWPKKLLLTKRTKLIRTEQQSQMMRKWVEQKIIQSWQNIKCWFSLCEQTQVILSYLCLSMIFPSLILHSIVVSHYYSHHWTKCEWCFIVQNLLSWCYSYVAGCQGIAMVLLRCSEC